MDGARTITRVGLVLAALMVAACAQNPPAPVDDLSHVVGARPFSTSQPTTASSDGRYTVRRGDTLYTIAFDHQLDWRDLADWNGVDAPYTIYPGMRLRLTAPPGFHEPAPAPVTPAPRPALATSGNEPGGKPLVATTPPPRPAKQPPAQPSASAPAHPVASTPSSDNATVRRVDGIAWRWPVHGALIDRFKAGDPTRQGIDIAGKPGAPVEAAADGVVIYSGNGLVGYGELVIIKHNDAYWSAYGHNRKRFVHEGDHVRAGQKIAEMGSTGAPRTELHFEIRRHGKPVDPLGFLPRR